MRNTLLKTISAGAVAAVLCGCMPGPGIDVVGVDGEMIDKVRVSERLKYDRTDVSTTDEGAVITVFYSWKDSH